MELNFYEMQKEMLRLVKRKIAEMKEFVEVKYINKDEWTTYINNDIKQQT